MNLVYSGKVRDVYSDGDDLILVSTDRVSVYDVILPTEIPDKGIVLNKISLWWFEQLADLVPNHVLSATDVPAEFSDRATRCQRLDMIPVECIARNHIGQTKLSEPIFTPTTKAPIGQHDEPIEFDAVVTLLGRETAEWLQDATLSIFARATEIAAKVGLVLSDTKFEFGRDADGMLVLADEVLTPDSSRYWDTIDNRLLSKQIVRNWAVESWNLRPPAPEIPAAIIDKTRRRYIEAYERLTGRSW